MIFTMVPTLFFRIIVKSSLHSSSSFITVQNIKSSAIVSSSKLLLISLSLLTVKYSIRYGDLIGGEDNFFRIKVSSLPKPLLSFPSA